VLPQAVYSPKPDAPKLAAARTAGTPTPFEIQLGFCVLPTGKTVNVHVVGNDPDAVVAKVVIDTLAKWRFKPFMVDGKAIKVCSEQKYVVEFL
jgi:protein TonB